MKTLTTIQKIAPACLVSLLLVSGSAAAEQITPRKDHPMKSIWIHRAFLVEPGTDEVPRLVDVLIEAGIIAEIRDTKTHDAESFAQHLSTSRNHSILDADRRFLLPGFIDTHAHVALGPVGFEMVDGAPRMKISPDPEVSRRSLLSLLAHGITTVRDPGGPGETLVALRRQQQRGEIEAPRLLVAGEVIDRQPFAGLTTAVNGPEEARAEVRRQVKAGVDWIKLYTQLDRDELQAAIDEAHTHGVPTVAHLQRISWTEGAELGLDALVHGVPGSELLLPHHTREAYLPDLASTRFLYSWFEHADFASPEIQTMLRTLKNARVTLDLTLVAFEGMMRGNDPSRTHELRDLEWAAPSLVENWRSSFTFNVGWQDEDFERAGRAWPKALEFARLLHESGLLLSVGTDANNPWTVPGPSFHRELELLAEAGISPRDILRMATGNGARALALDDEVGALRVGLAADLVLLERNPLEDISATREITWVMQGGRLHEPKTLLGRVLDPAYDR